MTCETKLCIGTNSGPCGYGDNWPKPQNITGSSLSRCRDCDIEWCLDEMQCRRCGRMQYRIDHDHSLKLGMYLWGEPCRCVTLTDHDPGDEDDYRQERAA